MSESLGITAGVAGRYAAALFELAEEKGVSAAVRDELERLSDAISASPELRDALTNPSVSRAEMTGAMDRIGAALGASEVTKNFVKLMASKRRLGALTGAIAAFGALLAEKRGEQTVEVLSAAPLSEAQAEELRAAAERATGKTIRIKFDVDPELIGGVVMKLGSRMIDASLRSKLAVLQQRMKEVG